MTSSHATTNPPNVDRVSRLEQTRAVLPQFPVQNFGPVFCLTSRGIITIFISTVLLFLDLFYVVFSEFNLDHKKS